MSSLVAQLAPHEIWQHFVALNAVPRPSKKEERVIQFIVDFGNQLGLPTIKDATGNILIKKPATQGMENRQTVVMQSHLDMVHQKNAETDFNFDTQGIDMLIEGDWVKAKGTTLGADNGIGVASIMGLLASSNIPHPALEALFTIDEETGMTGALGLAPGFLNGRILLNLDTEDDREMTIGCAGGVDVTAIAKYEEQATTAGLSFFRIQLKGLTGGHSGMDIHKGRGNANKLMNRLLYVVSETLPIRINSIDGGSLRNAIPRESMAIVAVPSSSVNDLEQKLQHEFAGIKAEHSTTDGAIQLVVSPCDAEKSLLEEGFQKALLNGIYACPNGIYRMCPDIAGLVQTSNNVARVLVKDGSMSIQCLTRSSVDSEKMDLAKAIKSSLAALGGSVNFAGSYPGWAPRPGAGIVALMNKIYQDRFHEEPMINACHAGLECGIIGKHYPEMEMISFGPNIHGAHSPDETVQISSVQKYWGFLLETLQHIPSN